MACGGKRCCCSGCTPIIDERAIRVGCCKCIPLGLCVEVITYNQSYQKFFWRECGRALLNGATELTLFADSLLLEGQPKNIKFMLVLEDAYGSCESEAGCSFCVEIDGVRDCIEVNHYEQHDNADTPLNPCPAKSKFCCTFQAAFELDLPDIGTVSLTTAASEFLDRTGPGRRCGGCNCICECACIGVASLLGSSNTQVCAEFDSHGDATWSTPDGVVIALVGRDATYLEGFSQDYGSEASGNAEGVVSADRMFHVLQPDGAYGIDATYAFQTNTNEYSWSVTWSGYITDENATAFLYAWNWETEYWDLLCEPQGAAQTEYGIPRTLTLDPEHTGSGDDEGRIRIRVVSETATEIGIDSILFKTPDCCKLRLVSVPEGLTPSEGTEPADVAIDAINNCPNPTAVWSFFTPGDLGDEGVFITFDCAFCEECLGSSLPCCPNPIPRVLTATLEIDCYGCDEAMEFPLVFEPGATGWTGGPVEGTCFDLISAIWPGGTSDINPCFDITLSVGGACTSYTTSIEATCDPLYVVINGYFDECINVCKDLNSAPPINFTLTITE